MRAFLHCLREYECQEEADESKRYNVLNTALPSNPGVKFFIGTKAHPWLGVELPSAIKLGKGSTAAGAYQITVDTWKEMVSAGWSNPDGEKDLFSQEMQDRIAVIILERTNAALSLVRIGEIEGAVKAVSGRWASLPGGSQNGNRKTADGKPMDMIYFLSLFNTNLAQEKVKQ